MASLKQIVERSDTRLGRAFDLVIQSLIVVSLISFSVETLPDLSAGLRRCLRWTEVVTVAVFTVEYVLRIIVADRKLSFIFSFFGLVDLVAILPFYVAPGVDLRSVRTFRFLRLIRVFKLARYSKAVRRFHRALLIAWEELALFLFVTLILLYLAAVGIYYFENEAQPDTFASVFHCLWWAVVTLTTVGYGDIYPITAGGKVFTFFVMLVGLGVIAVPAGIVATALSKARETEEPRTDEVVREPH
jgi:voltage-gated potassium channel